VALKTHGETIIWVREQHRTRIEAVFKVICEGSVLEFIYIKAKKLKNSDKKKYDVESLA